MKEFVLRDDPAVLDLVAHFLGIATHDNVNAPPSCLAEQARSQDLSGAQVAVTVSGDGIGAPLAPRRDSRDGAPS